MQRIVWVFVVVMIGSTGRAADSYSADDIMKRATEHNAFGFTNVVAHVKLLLQGPERADKERQLDVYAQTRPEQQCTLVRFTAPADVAGTAFLTRNAPGAPGEQYLYLPALAKTKRVTGSQRDQKFAGTDLTYADIQEQTVRDADLKRLADTTTNGQPTYVIEAIPKDSAASPYGKIVSYVHRDAFVPVKIAFFDGNQKLLKVLSVQKLEKHDGRYMVMGMQVEDVQAGSKTRMTVEKLDASQPPPARMCSPDALAG